MSATAARPESGVVQGRRRAHRNPEGRAPTTTSPSWRRGSRSTRGQGSSWPSRSVAPPRRTCCDAASRSTGSALGTYGGTVDIVVSAHGPGTQWLAGLRAHDEVDIVGPLGRAFPLPKEPVATVLVGGGYGSAPLFWLAEALRERGCRVEMVLGAATESRLFGVVDARRCADGVTIITDDGSLGHRGWSPTCCPTSIGTGAGVVYGCGPMGMLRSITAVAAAEGAVAQVAVEESMACGVGVCMTCVMPVRGNDGVTRMVRSCVEDRSSEVTGSAGMPSRTAGAASRRTRSVPRRRGRPLMGVFGSTRVSSAITHPGHSASDAADAAAARAAEAAPAVDMSVDLAGAVLPSPMMTASGYAANGRELHRFFDVAEARGIRDEVGHGGTAPGRGTPPGRPRHRQGC